MSELSRREWLRLTATGGGAALLLPNVTGILASPDSPAQAAAAAGAATTGRQKLLADFGWKFHLGHANDPTKDFNFGRGSGIFSKSGSLMQGGGRGNPGIAQAGFDTSAWQSVDLPHDWAVDLPFVEDRGVNGHGAKPLGRNYPETSIGWYRREFTIQPNELGRRFALEFDGVFRDATVILNGHFVGRNLSGYAPFRFDVTDFLTYVTRDQAGAESPGKNVLLVRVDATEGEGWFYEGAGIYRHVWLESTAPVHIAPDGVFVTPELKRQFLGRHERDVEVENESDESATMRCRLRAFHPAEKRRRAVSVLPPPGHDSTARTTYLRDQLTHLPSRTSGRSISRIFTASRYRFIGGPKDETEADRIDVNVRHPHHRLGRRQGPLGQRPTHQDPGHVQSPGPRRRRRGTARSAAVLPHRAAEGDGRERVPHVAQPADARTARRVRQTRHARPRRDAHDVRERRGPESARADDQARSQSSVRLLLVDRQRGARAGHRPRRAHRRDDEAQGPRARSHPHRSPRR